MNQQKITPYDVTNRFYNVISEQAERCGIDFDEFYNRQNFNGLEVKRGIEISKEYRGKVLAVGREWSDNKGNSYASFVFHTEKHGGITEKFNGFTAWNDAEKYGNYTAQPVSTAELQRRETAKLKSQQEQANRQKWSADKFQQAAETFKTLPKAPADFAYLVAKFGEHAAKVTTFTDLRTGIDERGAFIIFELKSGQNNDVDKLTTVGFQKIYDRNIAKAGEKYRDKDITGTKKGAFHIIGDMTKAKKGIYFAEGFATAAAIHLATGQPVVVCLDTNNLIDVVRKFSAHGYRKIFVCADNDISEIGGNVGIYSALKAAHSCEKARVFVPSLDGKKCDYADLLKAKGLPALKTQLKTRLNDCELKLAKTPLEYQAQLLNYAPIDKLKRVIEAACFAVAAQIPSQFLVEDGIKFVQARIDARGYDFKAAWLIGKILDENKKPIIERNTITDKGVIYHDAAGKTPEQIAALMKKHGGVWCDNRPLMSGKTLAMTVLVRLFDHKSCVYITHRIALTQDAATRLGLLHYSEDGATCSDNLCVCVNSIAEKFDTTNFDVALFDEFRQTKEAALDGEVDKRLQVFERMKATIQNGKLVVLADADLSNDDVDFIRSITDKPIHAFKNFQAQSTKKTMALLPTIDTLQQHALDTIKAAENVFIGCDTKAAAENTYQHFLNNGIDASDILLIHAENRNNPLQKAFLENPNIESIKYKCVIYSPVISSGVSITNGHFSTNYGIFKGATLPTNECLQSIARNRSANLIYVAIEEMRRDLVEDVAILKEGEVLKRGRFLGATFELHQLDHLRIELRARRAADSNNFKNNFLTLAELKGYELRHEQCEVAAPIIGLNSDVRAAKNQALFAAKSIDDKTARYYKNKACTLEESLELERHDLEKFMQTSEITFENIEELTKNNNELIHQVHNYELLQKSEYELKQSDLKNHETRDRLRGEVSTAWLMRQVLAMVIGQQITNTKAAEICAWLTDNAAEFAANGLGNFTKKSARPILTLSNLFKRFGYVLKNDGQESTGDRKLIFSVVEKQRVFELATMRKTPQLDGTLKNENLATAHDVAAIYQTIEH